MQKTCGSCGTKFGCIADQEPEACWCFQLPNVATPVAQEDCLCPECLKSNLQDWINDYIDDVKSGQKINQAHLYQNPGGLLLEDFDYYIENGRWVFTAWYLLKRGYCCGSGCRHCPYP